jgi:triacylglycerol lipase
MLTLDPTKTGFDWGNARALAEASALAYASASSIAANEGIFVEDEATHAAAVIQDRGDCIMIAFRGSKSPEDFIKDAEFWLTNYGPGYRSQVHHGFASDWRAIRNEVKARLEFLLEGASSRCKVFITGHSLGGALAVLAADEINRCRIPVAAVYTFGAPRVGNGPFRDIYNAGLADKTFCIVNQNDIVPRTPPLLMDYKRVGQKLFLAYGGGYDLNPPLWVLLLSAALGLWGAYRNGKDVLISEHYIAAYQQRIQGL